VSLLGWYAVERLGIWGVDARTTLIVHPHPSTERLERLQEGFLFHPSAFELLTLRDLPSGFILEWVDGGEVRVRASIPPASMWAADEIRFLPL
jgi:hypothetical protein